MRKRGFGTNRRQDKFRLFQTCLRRNSGGEPEHHLYIGVLVQAARDALMPRYGADPNEAHAFFYDTSRFETICDMAAIEPIVAQRFYEDLRSHWLGQQQMAA